MAFFLSHSPNKKKDISAVFAGVIAGLEEEKVNDHSVGKINELREKLSYSSAGSRLTKTVRKAVARNKTTNLRDLSKTIEACLDSLKKQIDEPFPAFQGDDASIEGLKKHQTLQNDWIAAREASLAKLENVIKALTPLKHILPLEHTGLKAARQFVRESHAQFPQAHKKMSADLEKKILTLEATESKNQAKELLGDVKKLPIDYNNAISKIAKDTSYAIPNKGTQVERLQAQIKRNNAYLAAATAADTKFNELCDRSDILHEEQQGLDLRIGAVKANFTYGAKRLQQADELLDNTTFTSTEVAKYEAKAETLEKQLHTAEAKESKQAIGECANAIQTLLAEHNKGKIKNSTLIKKLEKQKHTLQALQEKAEHLKEQDKSLKTGKKEATNAMELLTQNLEAIRFATPAQYVQQSNLTPHVSASPQKTTQIPVLSATNPFNQNATNLLSNHSPSPNIAHHSLSIAPDRTVLPPVAPNQNRQSVHLVG